MDADLTGKEMEEFLHQQQEKIDEMEKPWEQKLKEQQEKDEQARQEKEIEELNNKRAPHLTNLNEDV